jgi:hypothetical protein
MIFLLSCMAWAGSGVAQSPLVAISAEKTTSLVFASPVLHVDRGSREVLVEQVPAASSVLLVKAATPAFTATNLTVVTGDGSVYSFALRYRDAPDSMVLHIASQKGGSLQEDTRSLLDNPPLFQGPRAQAGDVEVRLCGIYAKDRTLFFQVSLQNHSSLDYPIDGVHFWVRGHQGRKRTASQETERKPLAAVGNRTEVRAGSENILVFALPAFTLLHGQRLTLEVMEQAGGRQLSLTIPGRKLTRARRLPVVQ